MKLGAAQKAALIRALHSAGGADTRLGVNPKLDDEALTRWIAHEFGIAGGYAGDGVRYDYRGGMNPRITIQIDDEPPLDLSGRELLAAVRQALGVGRPGELF